MNTERTPRVLAATMLSALSLAACAPSAPGGGSIGDAAVAAEVTTWLDGFWKSWEEGAAGYDRSIAMFDDHPDFSFAIDGATLPTIAALDQAYRAFFATVDHQVFEGPPAKVVVLGSDLVHVTQGGTFTQHMKDGTVVGPTPYVATMVLMRSDGGWKVRFIHQSTPGEPAPSWEEGTWVYTGQLRGQSINTDGRFVFLLGPADGNGPMTAEAGTYVLSGDTVTNTVTFSTDANGVGRVYRYTAAAAAGDTMSYTVIDTEGRVTGQGRAVRVR